MTRLVKLDPGRGELEISFGYDPALVSEVKSLPRRRWDPTNKVWRVPKNDLDTVRALLSPLGFAFDEDGTSQAAAPSAASAASAGRTATVGESLPFAGSTAHSASTRAGQGATGPSELPDDTVSLSGLTERIQIAVKQSFPLPLWVVGEIVDHKPAAGRSPRGGHLFFALIEKHEGEDKPRARADAVLWKRDAEALLPALRDKGFELQNGIRIRARVRVDFWAQGGKFRLTVEDIDPSYTLGQMALDREKLLAELRQKGLHERQLALPLPRPILRVGVLTSPSADGWDDFRQQLEESGFGFAVTLVPVKVQGADLKRTVLGGLRWFASRTDKFDVVCILRGGGSRTDLAWFDDREVALAVAAHPIKILVGVGHERDRSVLDEIAHREKTPTALGAFLVDLARQEHELLVDAERRLRDAAKRATEHHNKRLRDQAHGLGRMLSGLLAQERGHLRALQRQIGRGTEALLLRRRQEWSNQRQRLAGGTQLHLERQRNVLDRSITTLDRGAARVLERAGDHLERQQTRCRLLDPRRVLERGFSLVRDSTGKVVTNAAAINSQQPIEVHFRDGRVRATVDDVTIEPRDSANAP